MSFHTTTFHLLSTRPCRSSAAVKVLEEAEKRLGSKLPASTLEWYSHTDALTILAKHSNHDPPIPVREFTVVESAVGPLLPIRHENQGVCTWAVVLDSSDDPPVSVDFDSNRTDWQKLDLSFSIYVRTFVWNHRFVCNQPGAIQAQNGPISPRALQQLKEFLIPRDLTFGWPGSSQYRFEGTDLAF